MTNIDDIRRVAVVLGATAGCGPEVATALGMSGMDLVLISPESEGLHKLAEHLAGNDISVAPLRADLDDPVELRRVVREARSWLTRVDVLVCNAAPQHVGPGYQLSLTELADQGYANLETTAEMCKEFLPGMISRRWGRIMFLPPQFSAGELQCLGKADRRERPFCTFGRRLAAEIGRSRVTVNGVLQTAAPALVINSSIKEQARVLGISHDRFAALAALQEEIGRLSPEEQVQAVVAFIAGKSGENINGMLIPVRGHATQRAVA